MAYERIDWKNEPSVDTPINEDNLNHMEDGIVQNETDIAGKMDANNPTGTGAVSINRLSGSVVGSKSVAMGNDCSATMANGVAMGARAMASGVSAIAMGQASVARANYSHSFGRISVAEGEDSVTFGYATNAKSDNQFVEGKYNEVDTDGTYAHIVGGGTGEGDRRNIETLDWDGNETIAGDFTNGNGETLHGIYEALPVDSVSGNPAVITDAFGGSVKTLSVTLEPIQASGTPSPSNPLPISGRTQTKITRTGKNMWNDTDSMLQRMSRNGATYTNTETDTKTAFNARVELMLSNSIAYSSTITTISSNGRYSIVVDTTNITYEYFRLKHNGSVRDLIISLPFSAKGQMIISFDVDGYNPSVVGGLVIKNIQLEIGSTATTYEPYNGETVTRTYGTTIYGGSDDVTGDGATSTKKLYEINGGFSVAGSGAFYKDGITDISDIPSLCNIYPMGAEVQGAGGANDHPKTLCWQKNGLQSLRLCVYDTDFADVTAFNTYLAQTPMQVIFDLATPTSIPLTAQSITLLHGDNVLTTDADSIEASYSADIALYIAKKIAEGVNSTRSLSKGGSSEPEEEVKEGEPKEER